MSKLPRFWNYLQNLSVKVHKEKKPDSSVTKVEVGLGLHYQRLEQALETYQQDSGTKIAGLEKQVASLEKLVSGQTTGEIKLKSKQYRMKKKMGGARQYLKKYAHKTGTMAAGIAGIALTYWLYHKTTSITEEKLLNYRALIDNEKWNNTLAFIAPVVANGPIGSGIGLISGGLLGAMISSVHQYGKKKEISLEDTIKTAVVCALSGAAGGFIGAELFSPTGTVVSIYAGTLVGYLYANKNVISE